MWDLRHLHDLAGHAAAEGSLYDDGRVCALWDEVDMEVDMEIEEQAARPTVEQEQEERA